MSIYEDIDKEFQNFITDKTPKPVGLLSNGSVQDNGNGYEAMEKEMADSDQNSFNGSRQYP